MKWDVKVLVIFMLTILAYGFSYKITDGSFALPLEYIDFSIAGLSLVFILKTRFSQYTFITLFFGLSFTYLLFGVNQMKGDEPTIFMVVRDFTILLFAVFLLIRVFRGKDKSFRGFYLFFGLVVVAQIVLNGLNFTISSYHISDLVKSIIVFVLSLLIIRINEEGDKMQLGIRRMFMLLSLYTFRNILWLMVQNEW